MSSIWYWLEQTSLSTDAVYRLQSRARYQLPFSPPQDIYAPLTIAISTNYFVELATQHVFFIGTTKEQHPSRLAKLSISCAKGLSPLCVCNIRLLIWVCLSSSAVFSIMYVFPSRLSSCFIILQTSCNDVPLQYYLSRLSVLSDEYNSLFWYFVNLSQCRECRADYNLIVQPRS
jgi:hypothetical protein